MNFSLINDFNDLVEIKSYIEKYNSINEIFLPVEKNSNFIVNSDSNCYLCSSATGKLYIVLPNANTFKGRFLIFVNVTENELISVNNLTDLTPVNNILNYTSLDSNILNSYSQYFSILVTDGGIWYKFN